MLVDNNKIDLQDLIRENAVLFWWMPEDKKMDLPVESLVEAILNYGDADGVRNLFKVLGIGKVADIFYEQMKKKRNNYFPQTKHYFTLYFKKHA